jgi:glycosyltransferase involved in cell wall biosynthesis
LIRVAVDANSLAWGWGGIPKYVHRLVSLLAAEPDLEITLLANRRGQFARIAETREVACRRRGGALWRNQFVSQWVERERPDVFWAPEALAPWRLRAPLVLTVHDLGPLLVPDAKPLTQRTAYKVTVRRAVARAARTIAVSHSTANDLQRLWRADARRVRVIYNGIDEGFRPGDRSAELVRASERWGLEGQFVLAVGSVEPRKGLEVLVEAAAVAASRGYGWQVAIAGGLGHRGEAIAREATAGGCRWLGPVDDDQLLTLYRAAAAVVVPSRYEGFGFTALEAMACGTPAVVAGDSGGLVETSGPAAVVANERSGQAWASAIERAVQERDRLAARALDHAARFRWSTTARETGDVLREAARS